MIEVKVRLHTVASDREMLWPAIAAAADQLSAKTADSAFERVSRHPQRWFSELFLNYLRTLKPHKRLEKRVAGGFKIRLRKPTLYPAELRGLVMLLLVF